MHGNYYVRAHLFGDIYGQIVDGRAIRINVPIDIHRREESGNGHGGAHSGRERSTRKHFGEAGEQIGSHATEGNRQLIETFQPVVRQYSAIEDETDSLAGV